jgi:hypothetical protein
MVLSGDTGTENTGSMVDSVRSRKSEKIATGWHWCWKDCYSVGSLALVYMPRYCRQCSLHKSYMELQGSILFDVLVNELELVQPSESGLWKVK